MVNIVVDGFKIQIKDEEIRISPPITSLHNLAVIVEIPCMREGKILRPCVEGETPNASFRVDIETPSTAGLFQIFTNNDGNILNNERSGACYSLIVDEEDGVMKVSAIDGVGDWKKEFVLSKETESDTE